MATQEALMGVGGLAANDVERSVIVLITESESAKALLDGAPDISLSHQAHLSQIPFH